MPPSPVKLTIDPDKRDFVLDNLAKGISATVISRSFQRKFGTVLPPQEIERMRSAKFTPQDIQTKRDVNEIRSKLPSHDRQLEFARALLEERMKDPDVSNNELVNLAKEYRSNITASQQIASISDKNADVQFVLFYGSDVQEASQGANITDAKFVIDEERDD